MQVAWEPNINRDIGWLVMREDELELGDLQIRDLTVPKDAGEVREGQEEFGYKEGMDHHVRTDHRSEVDCKEKFGFNQSMDRHVRTVHRKERSFVCPEGECMKRFGQKYTMFAM